MQAKLIETLNHTDPLGRSGAAQVLVDLAPDETIHLTRVPSGDVRIDGVLDEPAWSNLPAYDEFRVLEPDTLADTPYATRVRMFYTDKGLYVGIDMEQPADTLVARLSSRDQFLNRDA